MITKNQILTFTLLCVFLSPVSFAETTTIGGLVAYLPGKSHEVALPDGRKLVHSQFSGVLFEDNTDSPIHLLSQDCAGTDLIGSDGAPIQIGGACAAINADGDLMRISYLNTPPSGEWYYTGGTGKFAGATGGGTSEVIAVGPDGRFTVRYKGKLVLNTD